MDTLIEFIKKNINSLDRKRGGVFAREFEVLLLSLLDEQLKENGKLKLERYPNFEIEGHNGKFNVEFDAIAPEGLLNIEGRTLIEIKTRFSLRYLSRLFSYYDQLKDQFDSALLIIGSELDNDAYSYIGAKLKKRRIPFNLEIWDINKIKDLIEQNYEFSARILSNISNEVFIQTIEHAKLSSDNWQDERDKKISILKEAYNNDEIVLMIGAGVSSDAGVPNWNGLLKDLNLSIINQNISSKLNHEEKNVFANELVTMQNGAPLVSASYIKNALGDNFVEAIKKSLYTAVKPIKEQKLLESIAKLSVPRRRKVGIEAVITYNFDDLLETHLDKNGVEFKCIYREGDFEIPTKLSIYHVHGFIPKKIEGYKNLKESTLVFSEDGYLQMQNDPYSWSNIVQIKVLREKTCVLIGLSGIDPNLRRLFSIHSERFDGCKHYILLERNFKASIENQSDKFKEFSKLHHKIQEDTFREIGLNVIWYKDHSEVPNIIDKLRM